MNKLVLRPGEAVNIREPKTCWQRCGGTIVEVWPNYDHPENSIVGVIFPRKGFIKETSAFKASELLPWDYPQPTDSDMTKNKELRLLHFVLIGKWYDMIDSGEKPEEYRRITSHNSSRLLVKGDWIYLKQHMEYDEGKILNVVKSDAQRSHMNIRWRDYDAVCFHRGYTNITMTYEFKGTSIGYGNPAWGAPEDEEVFIIKLGKRL